MVECRRFAVGILIGLYVILSEILVLPVSWLPSWFSSTHRRPTKSAVPLLESLTPKTCVAVGILSLCALELEIGLCPGALEVIGKRRKKPLPGEGLTVEDIVNDNKAPFLLLLAILILSSFLSSFMLIFTPRKLRS